MYLLEKRATKLIWRLEKCWYNLNKHNKTQMHCFNSKKKTKTKKRNNNLENVSKSFYVIRLWMSGNAAETSTLQRLPPRGPRHRHGKDGVTQQQLAQHWQSYLLVGAGAHFRNKYNNKLHQAQTAHTHTITPPVWERRSSCCFLMWFHCTIRNQAHASTLNPLPKCFKTRECRPVLNGNKKEEA